jgi:hypothetical protein
MLNPNRPSGVFNVPPSEDRDENEAIAMAYGSGDFTLEEVGAFFGTGRSTISRKVRAYEKNGKWET